jgi:hypothetical protein
VGARTSHTAPASKGIEQDLEHADEGVLAAGGEEDLGAVVSASGAVFGLSRNSCPCT